MLRFFHYLICVSTLMAGLSWSASAPLTEDVDGGLCLTRADRTGAIPKDMGADAVARGEAGYLIAIWMEETVDEAGMVYPIMSLSAQNLPEEIAQVLNWMLAEMMVSAGQRDSGQSLSDYVRKNHKEFLLALQALSTGDEEKFLALAGVADGEEGFQNAAAVAEQVGQGVIQAMAKSGLDSLGNTYDSLRAWVGKQNWGIELRDRHEAAQAARKLQKSVIDAVAGTAADSKEVIRSCSDYLLQEELIDPEGAAALGFAYGVVESLDQLGQDVVQPELMAQCAMQLADLTISAVGGDEQAKQALKEIGSLAVSAPISAIPEAQAHWDQGNYFQAGASSVAVAEVALVAKFVKDLAVKSTRKALRWGRHRTTDWQASTNEIGYIAEALAYQRLKRKGFRDIVPIRNASNHGIDWVCRDKKGGIVFIEVKGHRLDALPRLSRSQKDMKAFTENRLNQAVSGQGHWKNVSPEVQSNARKLLDLLEDVPIRGYVINVDYAVSKFPRIRYYEWLNGVGNLANPTP
jgi:Holliday junction resolvase-like predicted endonuclease